MEASYYHEIMDPEQEEAPSKKNQTRSLTTYKFPTAFYKPNDYVCMEGHHRELASFEIFEK